MRPVRTRTLHVRPGGPRASPPLDRSTTFAYREPRGACYQRYGHPTGEEAERLLGELDGGHALLFPSGSGATTALVLSLLRSGSTIGLAEGAYYGTGETFRALEPWGLRFVEFDQTGPPPDDVDLVWVEAASNPLLTIPYLEAAAAHPAPLVVDATASTPILLRPLEHGADFVLPSATKFLAGHADALLGAVVCRDEGDAKRLLELRTRTGIVAAPDPAWLLLRGLPTLPLPVERQSASALELARRLAEHPRVERVRYPGLGDPRAVRWMEGGFGGLLSFAVAGGARGVSRGAPGRPQPTSTSAVGAQAVSHP